MNIFVTGATGYVGVPVVRELVQAGHDVSGLVRSEENAERLASLGGRPVEGTLGDSATYAAAAESADALVHLGFDYSDPVNSDAAAIDAALSATAGRESLVVYTSGMWVNGDTGGATYGDDAPTDDPARIVAWRVPHEQRVLDADGGGRTTAVIRPGYVYGRGGGLSARMFSTAAKKGRAEFIGDGENHWPNVHVDDLAALYRIIVEEFAGGVFLAVDGTPERVIDMAAAASRAAGADGSVVSVPLEKARERLGPVADAMCLDQLLVAPGAKRLGWVPTRTSFTTAAPTTYAEWVDAHG